MDTTLDRTAETTAEQLDSRWVKTSCGMCYVGCGVQAKVEDGVVVKVEGNPDSPQNKGRMCAKGKAAIMNLYNPNRVTTPMRRTNPNKGFDEDPGWEEISWDEAIDTIVGQLDRISDNPSKLWIQAWEVVGDNQFWFSSFGSAFGTPHVIIASSANCGKVVHPVEFFSGGGFHQQTDLHHTNYCVLIGTQLGIASRGSYTHLALDMADAKARGMKLVVVDPVGGHAAAKADEWIPIRPGTDAALGLSMLHVLLNEEGVYDEPFLKNQTNAPYLAGGDGLYLRDADSNEPLVFDVADGTVKPHNDPGLKDPSITGSYTVDDRTGRPTFELLREHVSRYTPEEAEKITTIPAATVRRMGQEFGKAACIGETITIDGVELPYRPACVDWARGSQGHKHGFHQCWPLKLINIVVGAVNVPGGILSTGARGNTPHHWGPEAGQDGMLEHGGQIIPMPHPKAFPGRTPSKPVRRDIGELFPLASHFHTLMPITIENPGDYGLANGEEVEVLLHAPVNSSFGSFGDIKKVAKLYQSLKFIFGFAVEVNETTLFDDIVLPFPSYLERFDFSTGLGSDLIPPCGQHDFHWQIRQPVVEAPPGVRHPQEVIQEIADRTGFLGDLYRLMNHLYGLKGNNALQPGQRYPIEDVMERATFAWFGEDHNLDWFKEHAVITLPRDIKECYHGPFLGARIPIYLEHFLWQGEALKEIVDEMGLDWDMSDYHPLSDWMPCQSYDAIQEGEYDLIAVHFKFPYVYGSYGNENPWVDEICEHTDAYNILLNETVGIKKGIKDGDLVWLESPVEKLRARVKLTQCIHPEAVGVGGHFGHVSPGMPIARGKGINFNSLLPTDLDHIDKVSTALDQCVQVKIYK